MVRVLKVCWLIKLGFYTKLRWLTILCFHIVLVPSANSQQKASTIIQGILRPASIFSDDIVIIDQENIQQKQPLILFYQSAEFELAWNEELNISDMVFAIRNANDEGLYPQDYHWHALNYYYQKQQKSETDKAYFDILLTDAFFCYASHLLSGKTDPEILYPGKWKAEKRSLNLVMLLQDALQTKRIAATLEGVTPGYNGYKKLREQLKRFRKIQNSKQWTDIPQGPSINLGQMDDRIPLVRQRLLMDSLSIPDTQYNTAYDSALWRLVKKFQQRHGLRDDGSIGKQTLVELNYSPADYIRKIIVNMERYRWLPWELGERYVAVNIPAFQLDVYEKDSSVMTMKAIVGRPERSTPVFSSVIRYVLINPTWTVPPTILKEDILPAVKQNVNYLERNNLRVINKKGEEVDPDGLPWNTYTERNFPFQLRQDPGVQNSLGLIKFQFPNRYSVFLHDTNAHYLFSESYRAISSGCIRIEHSFALANYLLQGTKWPGTKLAKLVSSGHSATIMLPNALPIHILYMTAFVDAEDVLHIRNDVYGLDDAVLNNLSVTDFLKQ